MEPTTLSRGADLEPHYGTRIRLIGTYRQFDARKRQTTPPEYHGHAIVETDDECQVLIGGMGRRPPEEIAEHEGRRVAVTGTLYPTAVTDPNVAALLMPTLAPPLVVERVE